MRAGGDVGMMIITDGKHFAIIGSQEEKDDIIEYAESRRARGLEVTQVAIV